MNNITKTLLKAAALIGAYALAGAAYAQTYDAGALTTTSATPGVPNTGGDLVSTTTLLALSALLVAGGAGYLYFLNKTS